MAWTLIASLVELRNEFNRLAPGRDKGADGSIGDSAHTSRSDHTPDEDSSYLRDHDADSKNEVHALDIDSSGPWPPGRTFEQIVMRIIAGERAKWLSKTDRCRLKYVIFNRKIYSQATDFEPVRYTGSDPHTNHAHFSGRYETACENDTRPWGVYPAPQPEKPQTNERWSDMATREEVKDACREALSEFFWDAYNASKQTETYLKAPAADQKRMRNARDTFAAVAADDLIGAVDRIDAGVASLVDDQK